jgi:hypothetical protein
MFVLRLHKLVAIEISKLIDRMLCNSQYPQELIWIMIFLFEDVA